MVIRKFSELIASGDTTLTATAVGDYLLIYDASEPLDINKVKVVSIADALKLATETARQAIVTDQAAGDLFYASAAGVLARLTKGAAGQILKMNSGADAPEWGGLVTSRQGGSATDWNTQGTTDYAVSSPKIYVGVARLSVTSGSGSSVSITFPSAYTNKPVALASPLLVISGSPGGLGIATQPSKTGLSLFPLFTGTVTFVVDVVWMSIGE